MKRWHPQLRCGRLRDFEVLCDRAHLTLTCNPSTQYLRVFVPSIMEHRRACTEARRLASTLFLQPVRLGSHFGRCHPGERATINPRFSQPNFPILPPTQSTRVSVPRHMSESDNYLRLFGRYHPACSQEHELRVLISCFVHRIGTPHGDYASLPTHTRPPSS